MTQGTELFNQKPERGIEFLMEHGVFSTPLDPHQVAMFLRENPDLDKKQIGMCCKNNLIFILYEFIFINIFFSFLSTLHLFFFEVIVSL